MEAFIESFVRIVLNTDHRLSELIQKVASENLDNDEYGFFDLIKSYCEKPFQESTNMLEERKDYSNHLSASWESERDDLLQDPEFSKSLTPTPATSEKSKVVFDKILEAYGDNGLNYYTVYKKIISLFRSKEIENNFVVNYVEDSMYQYQEMSVKPKTRWAIYYKMQYLLDTITQTQNERSSINLGTMKFLDRAIKFTRSHRTEFEIKLEWNGIKNYHSSLTKAISTQTHNLWKSYGTTSAPKSQVKFQTAQSPQLKKWQTDLSPAHWANLKPNNNFHVGEDGDIEQDELRRDMSQWEVRTWASVAREAAGEVSQLRIGRVILLLYFTFIHAFYSSLNLVGPQV